MKRILLLEDQGLVRAGMRELIALAEPDAEIIAIADYDEAQTLLSQQRFDFAFLDINLKSEKNGCDLLRFIRTNEIPVRAIMLSGYTDKELILECLQLGAMGFISKDFEDEQIFKNVLNTLFDGGVFVPLIKEGEQIEVQQRMSITPAILPESLGIRGRTLEVLTYLCEGHPNKTIARKMQVEEGTIRKDYVPRLFRIFKVTRRTELLIEVSRLGLRLPGLSK
ncbi:response regulator transcription factor [Undibacterium flavidum]|uniref:Response regulator transcription factor n=1 Tax=Undibacterium flavidum TaxID=2762297 RepID=A0ABR6YBQ3_9BURK|nr:response regulator transcription factor [Undibacterium flavidum]MBC3874069.1 response regulator transcription factor [Undibacterium flavidum]